MKKKVLFVIISLIILSLIINIYSISIDLINKTLIYNNKEIDKKDVNDFLIYLKNKNIRVIKSPQNIIDKIFFNKYNRLIITSEITENLNKDSGTINIIPYYVSVNNKYEKNRFNQKEINEALNNFKKNNNLKYYFNKIDEFKLNNRIILNKNTGKPVIFYKILKYKILKKKLEEIDFDFNDKLVSVIGFAGDVVIDNDVKSVLKKHGIDFPFLKVNHLLNIPDIMSINLECTISDRGKRESKGYTFKGNESEFMFIAKSPVDYVANANNHANDYGHDALLDTIEILNKYKIKHSGSGKNIEDAYKPEIMYFNNSVISMFSICEVPDEYRGYKTISNFRAKKDRPGIAVFDESILSKLFENEKKKNRLIFVQFHTGDEYCFIPTEKNKEKYKKLINLGADIVIGHHPHVINGMDIYKNKLIFYSLGDFLFDLDKPHADEGMIIYIYIKNNKILSWSFYPTVSHYGQVIIDENRICDVENRFIRLSK